MILIKFGGSVITDKREYRVFRKETVARLCREIKESGQDVIVVHGAGSFGHVLAKKYSLNDGYRDSEQIPAVAQVCYDMRDLNGMIVAELNAAGIPSVSVPPGSCMVMDDRELVMDRQEVIKGFLDKGIMPVLFGDVVLDRKLGYAILSGDQVMEKLTEVLDIDRVVFVSDIDGLFDRDPKTDPDAVMYSEVTADVLSTIKSETTVDDVTGGVVGKMRYMLEMSEGGRECILINGNKEGRLLSLLCGGSVPGFGVFHICMDADALFVALSQVDHTVRILLFCRLCIAGKSLGGICKNADTLFEGAGAKLWHRMQV